MARTMINIPEIKLAVVGVSRDCFPASLTKKRLGALETCLKKDKVPHHICPVVIENEIDAEKALADIVKAG